MLETILLRTLCGCEQLVQIPRNPYIINYAINLEGLYPDSWGDEYVDSTTWRVFTFIGFRESLMGNIRIFLERGSE